MFEGLKGNEKVKDLLIRLVAGKKLPQSLMLCGRDGIGKKKFALELAQSLVCTSLAGGLPCGKCPSCKRSQVFKLPTSGKKEDYEKVYFSGHGDVGMVVPNKNTIYVDAIRDLAEEANYRPYEGRARIFIIDEAEKLGLSQKNAANALLKTLEEPASTTYIILVTAKPSTILQTIHSRCQTIRFSPVDRSEIESHLLETTDLSAEDAKLVAGASKGSFSKAAAIDPLDYRSLRGQLLESIGSISGNRGLADALKLSNQLSGLKNAGEYVDALELLESLIRDLLLTRQGLRERLTHADIADEISCISETVPIPRLTAWIEEVESLKASLRFNINKKVGTDALFVKMSAA